MKKNYLLFLALIACIFTTQVGFTQIAIGPINTHQLTVSSPDLETVRLIGPGSFGSTARLNFGDSDYAYIDEFQDDDLRIYADLVQIPNQLVIGTETPKSGYKVSIDGKVVCEEVRIELSEDWPDYVFAKDYSLLPLEQVEQHIQAEQHLPGIPSAKEIEDEGLQVGEMNRLLLEKVEELTLYTIQQDKQIKQLLELAKTQQAQIDALGRK